MSIDLNDLRRPEIFLDIDDTMHRELTELLSDFQNEVVLSVSTYDPEGILRTVHIRKDGTIIVEDFNAYPGYRQKRGNKRTFTIPVGTWKNGKYRPAKVTVENTTSVATVSTEQPTIEQPPGR